MFFRGGERLIFQGDDIHNDYKKYNNITRGIYVSKIGEIAVENAFRLQETMSTARPKNVELSLWRVTDRNVSIWERGVDRSNFVIEKPNGERISYVLVPRMNTDENDPYPYEYTLGKDATFEDINDPRVIVIARSYKGVTGEIAKDLVLKNEEGLRTNYKFLTNEITGQYSEFSNPQFLKALTAQAVKMFEPNVYATFYNEEQQGLAEGSYSYIDTISQLINQEVTAQVDSSLAGEEPQWSTELCSLPEMAGTGEKAERTMDSEPYQNIQQSENYSNNQKTMEDSYLTASSHTEEYVQLANIRTMNTSDVDIKLDVEEFVQ